MLSDHTATDNAPAAPLTSAEALPGRVMPGRLTNVDHRALERLLHSLPAFLAATCEPWETDEGVPFVSITSEHWADSLTIARRGVAGWEARWVCRVKPLARGATVAEVADAIRRDQIILA